MTPWLELPLAALSWLGFRCFRWGLGILARRTQYASRAEATRWKFLSAELLARRFMLPVMMSNAPRWNPHAIIATAGPLRVQDHLTVDLGPVRRSARQWSLVLYTTPEGRTVPGYDPLDGEPEGDSLTLRPPPGEYLVSLRYYGWRPEPTLPALAVDGEPLVPARALPEPINTFYPGLLKRRAPLYRCLHFHIVPFLRWRDRLPEDFVRAALLPVGNPSTTFRYGTNEVGQRLHIRVSAATLDAYEVAWTLYSRDSFVLGWGVAEAVEELTSPSPEAGFWVLRLHPRRPGAPEADCAVDLVDPVVASSPAL